MLFFKYPMEKEGSSGKFANFLCLLEILLFCISNAHTKMTISGEGNDNPLQNSCLEKSMDRGAWRAVSTGLHA